MLLWKTPNITGIIFSHREDGKEHNARKKEHNKVDASQAHW